MPEPISEQIVLRVVSDLKGITIAGGFAQDVEVRRADESGEASSPTNKTVAITVSEKAPTIDLKLSYCGKDAYRMKVMIVCNIRHSGKSSTEVGTLRARVFADIHKKLGSDRNLNGLAADALLTQAQAGLEEKMPTADLELDVLYFTKQNDPYSL